MLMAITVHLISVAKWTRPTEQLQKAIQAAWKLHVLVLDFLLGPPSIRCRRNSCPDKPSGLEAVSLEQLHPSEFIIASAASRINAGWRVLCEQSPLWSWLAR
jgi:hypothetical protein